jgi:Putative zinc-finger
MSWHADEPILARYADGTLGGATLYSVEAHLAGCDRCRGGLSHKVDARRLDRMWAGVRDRVDAPQTGVIERILVWCGVQPHAARILMATPSLRPSWIVSVAASLAFAVLADRLAGAGVLPFLVVAPLVPVIGVAAAFARPVDPAWEIAAATPIGEFRLTMIRSAAVLAVSVGLALLAALGLPEPGWTALAWLLPSLGLTALTVALSTTSAGMPKVAGVVAASWSVGVVLAARLADERLAAFGVRGQFFLATIAVASIAVVVARRDAFERRVGA